MRLWFFCVANPSLRYRGTVTLRVTFENLRIIFVEAYYSIVNIPELREVRKDTNFSIVSATILNGRISKIFRKISVLILYFIVIETERELQN